MTIVVGVDDSEAGEAAARRAIDLAEAYGAELHVVYVTHIPASLLTAMATLPAGATEFGDAQRQAVWDRIGPMLDGAEVPVLRIDVDGYPPDSLVRYAEQTHADLVVVGSRGRGDLAALILGSTSHRVLHHAPCDVLIARSKEESHEGD